jgi:hypothetical protein
VTQAIARSDAVVVLLTRSAHRSAYVQQEIGFSEAKGKLVVLLVEPGVHEEGLAMPRGSRVHLVRHAKLGAGDGESSGLSGPPQGQKEQGQAVLALVGLLVGAAWLGSK